MLTKSQIQACINEERRQEVSAKGREKRKFANIRKQLTEVRRSLFGGRRRGRRFPGLIERLKRATKLDTISKLESQIEEQEEKFYKLIGVILKVVDPDFDETEFDDLDNFRPLTEITDEPSKIKDDIIKFVNELNAIEGEKFVRFFVHVHSIRTPEGETDTLDKIISPQRLFFRTTYRPYDINAMMFGEVSSGQYSERESRQGMTLTQLVKVALSMDEGLTYDSNYNADYFEARGMSIKRFTTFRGRLTKNGS